MKRQRKGRSRPLDAWTGQLLPSQADSPARRLGPGQSSRGKERHELSLSPALPRGPLHCTATSSQVHVINHPVRHHHCVSILNGVLVCDEAERRRKLEGAERGREHVSSRMKRKKETNELWLELVFKDQTKRTIKWGICRPPLLQGSRVYKEGGRVHTGRKPKEWLPSASGQRPGVTGQRAPQQFRMCW